MAQNLLYSGVPFSSSSVSGAGSSGGTGGGGSSGVSGAGEVGGTGAFAAVPPDRSVLGGRSPCVRGERPVLPGLLVPSALAVPSVGARFIAPSPCTRGVRGARGARSPPVPVACPVVTSPRGRPDGP